MFAHSGTECCQQVYLHAAVDCPCPVCWLLRGQGDYTDGLNEAENQQQDRLGDDRILELMSDTANLTSEEIINKLKEAVATHRSGAEPNDDLTLFCLKIKKL